MTLTDKALEIARTQIGVKETGTNSGPEVDKYLAAVGLRPGFAWCVAFTFWCYQEAAKTLSLPNPHIRTAGVLDHYNRAPRVGANRIGVQAALITPTRIKPGMLFVMRFQGGLGHTGFVVSVDYAEKTIRTLEGNTNSKGGREGVAVMERLRPIKSCHGFIDYGTVELKEKVQA
jgi:hypothetical protein